MNVLERWVCLRDSCVEGMSIIVLLLGNKWILFTTPGANGRDSVRNYHSRTRYDSLFERANEALMDESARVNLTNSRPENERNEPQLGGIALWAMVHIRS